MGDQYLRLALNGEVQRSVIERCEIRKAFGLHSIVIIDLRVAGVFGAGTALPVCPEWTPAVLEFGRRFDSVSPWHGYVHHHSVIADTTAQTGTILRYVLIGTSLPMNDERTRHWRNVTASSLARQIFRDHGLRTVTSVHPRVLPYWAQPGISDMALLQGLAAETGYRLFVDGPTGFFVNPRTLLSSPTAQGIPAYVQDSGRNAYSTLLGFTVLTGRMVPRESGQTRQAVLHGVDKRSSRLLKATGVTESQRSVLSTKAVSNFAAAQSLADAQALTTQGWITARADVNGDATLIPGSVVTIGGSAISTDNAGLWLVSGVTHLFDFYTEQGKEMFTTSIDLERDQIYAATFDRVASLTNTRDSINATMRDSQLWVAEYMEDIRC